MFRDEQCFELFFQRHRYYGKKVILFSEESEGSF
jgi:hypothetical protein